jgi:NAD(P)H-quinone oxidoreductase subunit 5
MQTILTTLLVLVGCSFLLATIPTERSIQWRNMAWFYGLALVLSLGHLVLQVSSETQAMLWFNTSVLSALMLPLVSFLALILTRYASTYLDGQPRQRYFQRWFSLSLLSVWGVISSNHMLAFFLAWVAISLCFHRLLMIFPNRPRAALAAHKKSIFARFAEFSLGLTFILFYVHWQSPWISDWLAQVPSDQNMPLPVLLQIGAGLLVLTALIKCAQLPIHGWLIQVVESPTPVSALLHAGIVNLGGFLIILFAPLISIAEPAKWLLLIWSGVSTLIAALVMHTRVSVKVRLAWSTSAQMGFMLLECALGYYELAVLHLLAHSLYKAHAFLNASSEVDHYLRHKLATSSANSVIKVVGSLVLALLVVVAWHQVHVLHLAMAILYVLALTTLFNSLMRFTHWWLSIPLCALLFLALYSGQLQALFSLYQSPEANLSVWELSLVSLFFLLFGTLYCLLRVAPKHPQSRRFYRWLYAGFYLDEWSTRLTLAMWPTKLPKAKPVSAKLYPQEML